MPPGSAAAALQLENSQLRQELDMLKQRLPAQGSFFSRSGSSLGGPQGAAAVGATTDGNLMQLTTELAQVGLLVQLQRLPKGCQSCLNQSTDLKVFQSFSPDVC
jgi:hypothetical protein